MRRDRERSQKSRNSWHFRRTEPECRATYQNTSGCACDQPKSCKQTRWICLIIPREVRMGGPRHAIESLRSSPPRFGRTGPFRSRLRLLFSAFALALWASAVLWFVASERARADCEPSNRIPGATVTRSNSNYDGFIAPRNTPSPSTSSPMRRWTAHGAKPTYPSPQ